MSCQCMDADGLILHGVVYEFHIVETDIHVVFTYNKICVHTQLPLISTLYMFQIVI